MSGKTVYLKMIAILQIMAQVDMENAEGKSIFVILKVFFVLFCLGSWDATYLQKKLTYV